jgi:SAM-dependent methyltransferase
MLKLDSPGTTPTTEAEAQWPIRLFKRSVLKQQKLRELSAMMGPVAANGRYLDIGSDNGVISYLLRQRGGNWSSVDLDQQTVNAIRSLVGNEVYQIDGASTPFADNTFDCVMIVDFLEHIHDDARFVAELHRILKPDGVLIVNTPHAKDSWLRRLRLALGQTDEKHGHVRHGYTLESLRTLLADRYTIQTSGTYSKFFTELVDTLIVQAVYFMQRNKQDWSKKGAVVTGQDLDRNKKMFYIYSLIYPVVWLISRLDALLFFRSGYALVARARVNKEVTA